MFRLSEAAAALGARLLGADRAVTAVATDSRQVPAGCLFVALRGERFDGHRFVDAALAAGAAAALVCDADVVTAPGASLLVVDDTRLALGRLAAWWRSRFPIPLVAVTGSNGKTTVKEMLAGILRAHAGDGAVLATEGNLNNDIGLPLTLLRLTAAHRYGVLEMGMNHLGEIRHLTALARPQVAVINNAGTAHIGELGSRENIARAKGEILEGLPPGGVRVLNADDAFLGYWEGLRPDTRPLRFGFGAGADVSARTEPLPTGMRLHVSSPAGPLELRLEAPGEHNARNALAAVAAALALELPRSAIEAGLAAFGGVKGRLQMRPGPAGCRLVDDTYNANPDSMTAAIAWLASLPGRRVLVAGDMGELGDEAAALHAEAGARARGAGLDAVLGLGELSRHTVKAFGAGATHHDDVAALVAALRPHCDADTTVLVKGSRFMRMERVVEALATAPAREKT